MMTREKPATIKELETIVGTLSKTSKMPCLSWGIPASLCKVGGKLRKVKGSTCEKCYAHKGAYSWPNVQNAYERRWRAYQAGPFHWALAMAGLLKKKKTKFFRWFDSGDLQDLEMLEHIVNIASWTPEVQFWLPTRETTIVHDFVRKYGKENWPENLVVRLSAPKIDQPADKRRAKALGVNCSTVVSLGNHNCPSSEQHGECQDCRKCWDHSQVVVAYKVH